ncbi:PREDICTED: uncharacterized protein LOC105364131 [Ceratosolen solmsi marchali]|uniref:Uncharacterized protein LOC105364131 n=1 Tax=Ceratosolen solmsi marchali TaxID=326594 RepID=A0AAJ7DXS2_9HYME|nr:PREDICTED: uncharacterized protein LOC105364131 [Ceratosolen solmsi marchali]
MKGKAKPTEFRGQRRPSAAAAVAAAGGTRPRVHPASTSIYWESVDSSGGSSGSGSRNYVDPWDLENYAYLRRHSIAVASPQPVYQASRNHGYSGRLSNHSPLLESDDYWYASAIREPGYDAPASVEEIYFRPPRPVSNGYYYQQPTYEDDESHYTAPVPLYTRLSEIEQAEALEELRTREMLRRRSKAIPGPMDYPRPR